MDLLTKQFITEHLQDDVRQLALQARRYPDINMDLALRQITGRQKIRHKVPFFYQNEDILYPVRLSLEQASSETTAYYKASLCMGHSFADLTGGMGVDTYFISQNFKEAVYVERQTELCQLAEHNFAVLKANHIKVVNSTAEKYLAEIPAIDSIYLDPARRDNSGKKLVLLSDCEPNVVTLADQLLGKAPFVLIKLSPMLDISSAINDIPAIAEIHILAVENECKETLLVLKREKVNQISVHTVNFLKNGETQAFSYHIGDENIDQTYTSEIKQYLYEPNAAIMKGGAFKLIAQRFNISKLHPHTHLYTSDIRIPDFPGRIFRVKGTWGYSGKEWKKQAEQTIQANVAVRNFPLKAEELKKKLKLSDGGTCYLFACTLTNNSKTIIECSKTEN